MEDAQVREIATQVEALRRRLGRSVAVAIDGGSGVGKSTLAFALTRLVTKAFVLLVDTYHVPLDCAYRMRPAVGQAGAMIDWRRFRETALRPALEDQAFTVPWVNPFSGRLEAVHEIGPGTIVLCDGTFSSRSELWDLYDLRILVRAPEDVAAAARRARDDELDADWRRYVEEIWLPDERRHLATLDAAAFDVVVDRAAGGS